MEAIRMASARSVGGGSVGRGTSSPASASASASAGGVLGSPQQGGGGGVIVGVGGEATHKTHIEEQWEKMLAKGLFKGESIAAKILFEKSLIALGVLAKLGFKKGIPVGVVFDQITSADPLGEGEERRLREMWARWQIERDVAELATFAIAKVYLRAMWMADP